MTAAAATPLTIGTLNTQHLGHTWQETCFLLQHHNIDCLAIQEATIHETTTAEYTRTAAHHGYQLLWGEPHNNHIRIAMFIRGHFAVW